MIRKDTLWKGILEEFFEEFMHFFFEEYVDQIDFSLPIEFMDKELDKIHGKSASKNRRADKLAKVWLKNGDKLWCMTHVEVQGYGDGEFPERMYVSNYRIKDRFKTQVAAIAV